MNEKLLQYLNLKNCFKLVLGANNSNYNEITNLSALYSSAGCRFFDIEASIDAYSALIKGINFSDLKRENIFVCASVGVNQDPHLTKFKIDKTLCNNCSACQKFCLEKAINNAFIEEKKCIGCAKCYKNTNCKALVRYQKIRKWEEFLPDLFDKVDCIEFHAITDDIDEINEKWEYLCSCFDGILSVCIDRSFLGDKKIIKQLNQMILKAKEKNKTRKIIIQADGAPMSAGADDYKTTLATIAFADLINKNNLDCFILLSGGTNSKTFELAKLLNVEFNGVSLGSYARKIVKEFVMCDDFLKKTKKFNKAKIIAGKLFNTINSSS